jgi:hypothetical protein
MTRPPPLTATVALPLPPTADVQRAYHRPMHRRSHWLQPPKQLSDCRWTQSRPLSGCRLYLRGSVSSPAGASIGVAGRATSVQAHI